MFNDGDYLPLSQSCIRPLSLFITHPVIRTIFVATRFACTAPCMCTNVCTQGVLTAVLYNRQLTELS